MQSRELYKIPLATVCQWTGAETPPGDGPAQFKGHTDWEMSCPQAGAEDRESERERSTCLLSVLCLKGSDAHVN